jgi:hypothetical protein
MENDNNTLNQGQKAAAEAFFEFLFDPNSPEFILSGPAGTGKTYWMGYIIDTVMPRYAEMCKLLSIPADYLSVVMTATTNKAAQVLAEATGRPTQTIHSFLNLTMYEDYSSGKTRLRSNPRTWEVHQQIILFIDECSMIDAQLYKMIQEGTLRCKIVYVGDRNQLAPVTETLSPIYRNNSPLYELIEQMRTHNVDLQKLNAQLRETVVTGVFKPIHEVPGVIDYLTDEQMEMELDNTFRRQTKQSRVLAYTNRRVIQYNGHIRNFIRNLPDTFGPGEILVNSVAIKMGRNKSLAVECEVEIQANYGHSQVEIEQGLMLDVDYVRFTTSDGNIYNDVPIPTDRAHFNDLIKHYKSKKNWERFFYMKQTFPDLRPRDAATVHKSQGSTYETVFVDLDNLSTCHQKDQAARMLYVAFSRAKTRVCVYGNLAEKYGGFVRT